MASNGVIRVKQLNLFEIDEVTETLSCAFRDDPMFKYICGPGVDDTEERLRPVFFYCVRLLFWKGDRCCSVYTSEDKRSAALWFHAGAKLNLLDTVLFAISAISSSRNNAGRMIQIVDAFENHHPVKTFVYLWVLGTHPDFQRQGRASSVLTPMLRKCDDEGMPIYLESSNPKNRTFYESHGFKNSGLVKGLPEGCPNIMSMWREPRARSG